MNLGVASSHLTPELSKGELPYIGITFIHEIHLSFKHLRKVPCFFFSQQSLSELLDRLPTFKGSINLSSSLWYNPWCPLKLSPSFSLNLLYISMICIICYSTHWNILNLNSPLSYKLLKHTYPFNFISSLSLIPKL